jgi:hypothetical protein
MPAKIITITPEMAKEMLSKNTRNRNLNQNSVADLAEQIKKGYWDDSNGETIKIYQDGNIADGQTRLNAVIAAKTPITTWIITELENNKGHGIDVGRRRNVSDVARIESGDNWYNNSKVALIRFLFLFNNPGYKFNSSIMQEIVNHTPEVKERINYAYTNVTTEKNFCSAPFVAAVASAYGYVDDQRLNKFCSIINTGTNADIDTDTAAVVIRDWALKNILHRSFKSRKDFFLRSQRAIKLFSKYKKCTRILEQSKVSYPIFL